MCSHGQGRLINVIKLQTIPDSQSIQQERELNQYTGLCTKSSRGTKFVPDIAQHFHVGWTTKKRIDTEILFPGFPFVFCVILRGMYLYCYIQHAFFSYRKYGLLQLHQKDP